MFMNQNAVLSQSTASFTQVCADPYEKQNDNIIYAADTHIKYPVRGQQPMLCTAQLASYHKPCLRIQFQFLNAYH